MTKTDSPTIRQFFKKLGLSEEETTLFLTLQKLGALTVLEASRKSGINRTKIYRMTEDLIKKGFLVEKVEANKTILEAISPDQLDVLIQEKESEIKNIREIFPEVSAILSHTSSLEQPGTKVLFYRGKEGIRQMIWNTLEAKDELLGFTFRRSPEYANQDFMNKWRNEIIKRNIKFKELYSDNYLKSIEKPIEEIKNNFQKPHFDSRYILSKILDISYQLDIYNNVIKLYNWKNDEIFGVEIYNQEIADMQKQIFYTYWKIAGSEELQELLKKKF